MQALGIAAERTIAAINSQKTLNFSENLFELRLCLFEKQAVFEAVEVQQYGM